MRPVNEIVIHTFATRKDWFKGKTFSQKVAEVKRWHVQNNKWRDLGYHFLISKQGEVADGRPIDQVGAHVRGHNTNTIGISLEGGFGGVADGQFSDNYTPKQEKALIDLIKTLRAQYGPLKLSGHNQYANKACPCFNVPKWEAGLDKPVGHTVKLSPRPKANPFTAFLLAIAKAFGRKS